MKLINLTTILAVVLFAIPTFSQTVNPAKLRIKGIGLDSTYAQVVRALGKPTSKEKPKNEECIGGRERSIMYPGLSFYMMDGDSKSGKTFEVKAFEVTAPKYLVSGVKIGDKPAIVRKKFGRKYSVNTEREPNEITWIYDMGDRYGPGTTRIIFKNGKVMKIASAFLVC